VLLLSVKQATNGCSERALPQGFLNPKSKIQNWWLLYFGVVAPLNPLTIW
jgi:hypothetical protein